MWLPATTSARMRQGRPALGNSGDGVEIDSGARATRSAEAPPVWAISSPAMPATVFSSPAATAIRSRATLLAPTSPGQSRWPMPMKESRSPGGQENTVGGAVAGAGNVISGNGQLGVWLYGNSSLNTSSNFVEGNLIGTNAMGMAVLGNGFGGIQMTDASANTIGGTTATARNVISGNSDNGVTLESSSSNNLIEGNYIGTAANGVTALGNASAGVWINNASSNTIGGTAHRHRKHHRQYDCRQRRHGRRLQHPRCYRRQFDLWRQRPGHRLGRQRRHAERTCQPASGQTTCKTIPSFPTPSPTARAWPWPEH